MKIRIGKNRRSKEDRDFSKWLIKGIDRGWVTEPFCTTHDGGYQYMSEEEIEEWDEGGDPCCHVIRIMI